jgi:Resolvase, N terminal domain
VLVYSPDWLNRKYAYQGLLAEEFSRCRVKLVFLQSPAGTSAEDQLVVQFQGMIAEYDRAQIAERSRRGKRYKAQQGVINVSYVRAWTAPYDNPNVLWMEDAISVRKRLGKRVRAKRRSGRRKTSLTRVDWKGRSRARSSEERRISGSRHW